MLFIMFSGIKEHYKAQITHSFTQLRKNMQFVPVVETQNKNIQIQIIFLSMRQTLFFSILVQFTKLLRLFLTAGRSALSVDSL